MKKKIIAAFVNPKFPRRRRTIAGVSEDTGATPAEVVAIISTMPEGVFTAIERDGKDALYAFNFEAFVIFASANLD